MNKRWVTLCAAALGTVMTFSVMGMRADAAAAIMPDGTVFDPDYYAAHNVDVYAAYGLDTDKLYEHYKEYGQKEGRLPADPAIAAAVQQAGGPVYQETQPTAGQTFTVSFAGDVNMDPRFVAGSTIARLGLAGCFDKGTLDLMRNSDVFMLNNEFPYTTRGSQNQKKWTFRADPKKAAMLKDIGTDVVSLANNHTFDYGEQGFLDTLDALSTAGVPYVGAGHNIEEARKPYYYENNGMRIAIVSATQIERYPNAPTRGASAKRSGVFRCYDPTLLYQTIAEAKKNADFVITYVHWGTEQMKTPDAGQKDLAKGMADAGADLIIGDHPHCLQTIGYVEGVPVIYSLGNYVFANYTRDTCLVQATFDPSAKKMASLKFIPLKADSSCRVREPNAAEKKAAISAEQKLSPDVHIDADGLITAK